MGLDSLAQMCKGRFRDMADTMNDEFAIAAREEGAVEWPPVDHQDLALALALAPP